LGTDPWKVKAYLTDDSESDARAFVSLDVFEHPFGLASEIGVSGKQSWRSSPTA